VLKSVGVCKFQSLDARAFRSLPSSSYAGSMISKSGNSSICGRSCGLLYLDYFLCSGCSSESKSR
jgi:hypothetical protein